MSRYKKIDYKGFANQMRQNACRNAEGNIVCSEELWKLIASLVEAKPADVAEEIFAEIEKEIELALDSNYKVKRDAQDDNDSLVSYVEGKITCLRGLLGFLAELKKKYTEEGK